SCLLEENARYEYCIEAWTDRFGSWRRDMLKRLDAAQDVTSDLLEGLKILEEAAGRAAGSDRALLERWLQRIREQDSTRGARLAVEEDLHALAAAYPDRSGATRSEPVLEVVVDRVRARFAAWYEFFPRSYGPDGQHGTFRDAIAELPRIAAMGFDVVYLPPIHPIGKVNRKGRNNSLTAAPDDPGSPWAIGSDEGGHDAVNPRLGTVEDFVAFREAAEKHGLEVALDFAIQAAPDHPWVKEHPGFFHHRPDGTIKFAENPPKKYEDIYPINFHGSEAEALWLELERVLEHWIGLGVKTFRVDNPHTKSFHFWEWVIERVKDRHPEVLFLAEAFTRPKVMRRLAKIGFSQSYTYFTWRNFKGEITEYLTELTQSEMREYYRGNLWPNTPDILHEFLVHSGRPGFKLRLALAATLSSLYGMYSGYEVCDAEPFPGKEEYNNNEKYQLRSYDWGQPGNIVEYITCLNRIRRENVALHEYDNLRFTEVGNDQLIAYWKATPYNRVLCVVNLDPHAPHDGMVRVPLAEMGLPQDGPYRVIDLITDAEYTWSGEWNYVRLDPQVEPAHVLRLEPYTG
ncbi:MAG TPA: maltotransferase domain-containing protein, partial [Deinococcales bacterium]|nr:maltotransferase domain-containing protein [Deinococcales bacterium]